jgi:hypothetical protein
VSPKLQISGGRPRYYVACPGSDSSGASIIYLFTDMTNAPTDAEDTGAYYGGPINSCISNPVRFVCSKHPFPH